MSRIACTQRANSSGRGICSRLIVAFAIMLTGWLPALAQQSQPYHLISAASTNATSIKGTAGFSVGGAGQVVTIVAINTTATVYYLKFYDTAATPTCNSTPVSLTLPIPATSSSTGGGFVVSLPQAAQYLNGIGICLTGGIADNDNSNAATGVAIDVFFK